ncbi:rhodanese-like domain-containing protein [Paragemmobacter straminiformis]|uniref:Sulfurtransferase n=1 Tax=Paragemmobacter straminiformis TaxID=2045119 RepID=A0A842I8S2_9RHOB|nr:rhodanese-like domain-containing protein [Gemmobacter straminiformis]MBC2835813.1 sulfurtransferase [Gemmobacter straminiformis]
MSGFDTSLPRLTATEAQALAAKGELLLLDVREAAELQASGKAKGALHVPVALVPMKADPKSPDFDRRFDPAIPVAVYCAAGGRAGMAAQTLGRLGYRAQNIGGFADWCAAGGAVEAQS